MQQITPNLWFSGNAREAIDFYLSVFKDGKETGTFYYPLAKEGGLADFQLDLAGKPLTIDFEILGTKFTAINAGPEFSFTPAISLLVPCKDQEEIDYYWDKLSAVPESEQCGWCQDKYGLSWQIVPANMNDYMNNPKAYKAMMNQKKIIIAEYEQ